jgi:O-antigen/teichoic acid export membrane protein
LSLAEKDTGLLPARICRILASPSIVAASIFLTSGAAFSLGNLLLARAMPVTGYGHFALSIALFNIFVLIAPLGIDQLALRHRLDPSPLLVAAIMGFALLVGVAVAFIETRLTHRPSSEAIGLAVAICAGTLIQLASSILRASGYKASSLLLATWTSWLLLAIGAAAQIWTLDHPALPLAFFATGNSVMATAAWFFLFRIRNAQPSAHDAIRWRESFSLLGIAAVGTIALQLERIIIPFALGVNDLALFSVLASTVIYPFRLLVAGTNFTLIPRLRSAEEHERKRLVRHEVMLIAPIAVIAIVAIVPVAPMVIHWLTGGSYTVGAALVGSACINGLAKLVQSFSSSVISGAGDEKSVHRLNRFSAIWIVAAMAGGWLGAVYGLIGLLACLSGAALIASTPTIILAWRTLND